MVRGFHRFLFETDEDVIDEFNELTRRCEVEERDKTARMVPYLIWLHLVIIDSIRAEAGMPARGREARQEKRPRSISRSAVAGRQFETGTQARPSRRGNQGGSDGRVACFDTVGYPPLLPGGRLVTTPFVFVYSQRMAAVAGTNEVRVEVEFLCPRCAQVRSTVRCVPRNLLHRSLDRALDSGQCGFKYVNPTRVRINTNVMPSIRSNVPATPISARELAQAQKFLSRLSTKRTSKSWNEFLRRLRQDRHEP